MNLKGRHFLTLKDYTPEEIDKSFLIGGAMKSNKIEDWEELILCYSLLRNSGE